MQRALKALALLLFAAALTTANAYGDMRGGGLYFGWSWPAALGLGMTSLDMDLRVNNDPITTDVLFFSTQLYCGTQTLRNVFYFGIQTNVQGRGRGLIFSRFGTRDLANAETAGTADSWSVSSGSEGDFIGVRRTYYWTAHHYVLRLRAMRDDSDGRWFGFWLIDKDLNAETYGGALKFPKDSNGMHPLIMVEGFGSFIEHARAVPSPDAVPLWDLSVGRPIANTATVAASAARWWYAAPTDAWQNSDMWAEADIIRARMGQDTQRVHPSSRLNYGPYIPSQSRRRAVRH